MSFNYKRPVISYENVTVLESDFTGISATETGNLSFVPHVQSLNFSFGTERKNIKQLASKDFASNQTYLSPDINLNFNKFENLGNFFKEVPKILSGQNSDKNILAIIGDTRGTSFTGDTLSGKEVLGFGNCFLENVSIRQSLNGLLEADYSYIASNVQATVLDSKVLYHNDFEHFDAKDYSVAGGGAGVLNSNLDAGGSLVAGDLEDGRGLVEINTQDVSGVEIGAGEGIVQTVNASGMPGDRSLVIYDGALLNGFSISGFSAGTIIEITGTNRNRHGNLQFRWQTGRINSSVQYHEGRVDTLTSQGSGVPFFITGTFGPTGVGHLWVNHRKTGTWGVGEPLQAVITAPDGGESVFAYVDHGSPISFSGALTGAASSSSTSGLGRLAVLDTPAKYQKFQNFLHTDHSDYGRTDGLQGTWKNGWIGLTDTGLESNSVSNPSRKSGFFWINGVRNVITGTGGLVSDGEGGTAQAHGSGFQFDEPNNAFGNEDFVYVTASSAGRTGRWNDINETGSNNVEAYFVEKITSSSFISDLTIKERGQFEYTIPSIDLTGAEQRQVATGFLAENTGYFNSLPVLTPSYNTKLTVRRNSYAVDEFTTRKYSSTEDIGNTKLSIGLQSKYHSSEIGGTYSKSGMYDSAGNKDLLSVNIEGENVYENTVLARGIGAARIKLNEGVFVFDSGNIFDTYGSSLSTHQTLSDFYTFMSGFNSGDILALNTSDTIFNNNIQADKAEIIRILTGEFGANDITGIVHRDAYNLVAIKGGNEPIYEELSNHDSILMQGQGATGAETPRATVYLDKDKEDFVFKSDGFIDFNLSIPINRKTVNALGKKYPISRKVITPTIGNVNFQSLASDLVVKQDHLGATGASPITHNLLDLLEEDPSYTLIISGAGGSYEDFHIRIRDAKINSQSFSSSIGSPGLVDYGFSFSTQNIHVD